jgi:hypothetical protein
MTAEHVYEVERRAADAWVLLEDGRAVGCWPTRRQARTALEAHVTGQGR